MTNIILKMHEWCIKDKTPYLNLGKSGENNIVTIILDVDKLFQGEENQHVQYFLDICDKANLAFANTQTFSLQDGVLKTTLSREFLGVEGVKLLQVRCVVSDSHYREIATYESNIFHGIVGRNSGFGYRYELSYFNQVMNKVQELMKNLPQGNGTQGKDGLSAYDIALKHGFRGTEQEWIESLKAVQPKRGVDYWTQQDIDAVTQEAINVVTDYVVAHEDVFKGKNGNDGQDGHTPIKGVDYFTDDDISEINATLTNHMIDYFNQQHIGVLNQPITAQIDVGGVKSGTIYDQGTPLEKILQDIFKGTTIIVEYPTLTNPNIRISTTDSLLFEKGTNPTITIKVSYNRGKIEPAYGTNGYRAGNMTKIVINNQTYTTTTCQLSLTDDMTKISATLYYADGEQPKDSVGNNYDSPLKASSIKSNSLSCEFVDALYANTQDIANTAKLPLVSKMAKTYIFAFPPQTKRYPEQFCIPNDWSVKSIQIFNPITQQWENCEEEFTSTIATYNNKQYIQYTDNRGYNAGDREVKITWE